MAGSSRTRHLTIVNHAHIWCTHSVQVLVVLIVHKNNFAVPLVTFQVLTHVLLALRSTVQTDHRDKVAERQRFRAEWSWRRIFQQEFFYTSSDCLSAELCLVSLITWGKEDDSCIVVDLMLLTERGSNAIDSFFKLWWEVSVVSQEAIFFEQMS